MRREAFSADTETMVGRPLRHCEGPIMSAKTWFETTVTEPESGVEFDVAGYAKPGYQPGADDPGEAADIEDYVIRLERVDVTDIISERSHRAIVEATLESLKREGVV